MEDSPHNSLGKASKLKNFITPACGCPHYIYKKNDPAYEEQMKKENRIIFKSIDLALDVISEEAKNGFREYSLKEQIEIIQERKYQFEKLLRSASLYPEEVKFYRNEFSRKIEEIYKPYMKWSRKKAI